MTPAPRATVAHYWGERLQGEGGTTSNPPSPKSAAEFGRLRRFILPICWVSGFRPFVLLICGVSVNSPIRFADTESVEALAATSNT